MNRDNSYDLPAIHVYGNLLQRRPQGAGVTLEYMYVPLCFTLEYQVTNP